MAGDGCCGLDIEQLDSSCPSAAKTFVRVRSRQTSEDDLPTRALPLSVRARIARASTSDGF